MSLAPSLVTLFPPKCTCLHAVRTFARNLPWPAQGSVAPCWKRAYLADFRDGPPQLHLLSRDRQHGRGKSPCLRPPAGYLNLNLACSLRALNDRLRQPIEQGAPWSFVALLAVRVAVSDADQLARAGNVEGHHIACRRYQPPLAVERLHPHHRQKKRNVKQ